MASFTRFQLVALCVTIWAVSNLSSTTGLKLRPDSHKNRDFYDLAKITRQDKILREIIKQRRSYPERIIFIPAASKRRRTEKLRHLAEKALEESSNSQKEFVKEEKPTKFGSILGSLFGGLFKKKPTVAPKTRLNSKPHGQDLANIKMSNPLLIIPGSGTSFKSILKSDQLNERKKPKTTKPAEEETTPSLEMLLRNEIPSLARKKDSNEDSLSSEYNRRYPEEDFDSRKVTTSTVRSATTGIPTDMYNEQLFNNEEKLKKNKDYFVAQEVVQSKARNGKVAKGSKKHQGKMKGLHRWLRPDGRLQVIQYFANDQDTGLVADLKSESHEFADPADTADYAASHFHEPKYDIAIIEREPEEENPDPLVPPLMPRLSKTAMKAMIRQEGEDSFQERRIEEAWKKQEAEEKVKAASLQKSQVIEKEIKGLNHDDDFIFVGPYNALLDEAEGDILEAKEGKSKAFKSGGARDEVKEKDKEFPFKESKHIPAFQESSNFPRDSRLDTGDTDVGKHSYRYKDGLEALSDDLTVFNQGAQKALQSLDELLELKKKSIKDRTKVPAELTSNLTQPPRSWFMEQGPVLDPVKEVKTVGSEGTDGQQLKVHLSHSVWAQADAKDSTLRASSGGRPPAPLHKKIKGAAMMSLGGRSEGRTPRTTTLWPDDDEPTGAPLMNVTSYLMEGNKVKVFEIQTSTSTTPITKRTTEPQDPQESTFNVTFNSGNKEDMIKQAVEIVGDLLQKWRGPGGLKAKNVKVGDSEDGAEVEATVEISQGGPPEPKPLETLLSQMPELGRPRLKIKAGRRKRPDPRYMTTTKSRRRFFIRMNYPPPPPVRPVYKNPPDFDDFDDFDDTPGTENNLRHFDNHDYEISMQLPAVQMDEEWRPHFPVNGVKARGDEEDEEEEPKLQVWDPKDDGMVYEMIEEDKSDRGAEKEIAEDMQLLKPSPRVVPARGHTGGNHGKEFGPSIPKRRGVQSVLGLDPVLAPQPTTMTKAGV